MARVPNPTNGPRSRTRPHWPGSRPTSPSGVSCATGTIDHDISEEVKGPIITKRCALCSAEKPLSGFGKDRHRADGLDYRCKACRNERSASWRRANPEAHKESDRKGRPKWNARRRAFRAKNNPEGVRACHLGMWRSANPRAVKLQDALMALRRLETKYNLVAPELAPVWVQIDAVRQLLALATGTTKEVIDSGTRWRQHRGPHRKLPRPSVRLAPRAENPSE